MPLLVPDDVYADLLRMREWFRLSGVSVPRRGGWSAPVEHAGGTRPPFLAVITSATNEVTNQRWLYTVKPIISKLSASKTAQQASSDLPKLRNLFEYQAKGGYTDTDVSGLKVLPVGLTIWASYATDSDGTAILIGSHPNEPVITC